MKNKTPVVGRDCGQKPVDLVAATGYRSPQDAVWESLRELKKFTLADVMAWMLRKNLNRISQETTKSYLQRLRRGGYIEIVLCETVNRNTERHTYKLTNDVGVHAPRLTRDGTPSKQGMGRANMWRSMKILNSFDYKELVEMSSNELVTVKPAEAKDYIKHLFKAGYLRLIAEACRRTASPARYVLKKSMNTGYHPPMVQRIKRIFDQNLNKVMDEQGEDN